MSFCLFYYGRFTYNVNHYCDIIYDCQLLYTIICLRKGQIFIYLCILAAPLVIQAILLAILAILLDILAILLAIPAIPLAIAAVPLYMYSGYNVIYSDYPASYFGCVKTLL